MYFEFVTPRMLILHPIMSIKVLRNSNLIHDSFDGRVVNALRARQFLRNYDGKANHHAAAHKKPDPAG